MFLFHEGCPKCGSRDNLGVYEDGHSYCFGCGYRTPSKTSLHHITKHTKLTTAPTIFLPNDYTNNLPLMCQEWLKKYGITNLEIEELKICWSASTGLLLFPQWGENTTIMGYSGRRFTGEGPKYIIRGIKTDFTRVYGHGDTIVYTEDILSALKASRLTAARPLFGTALSRLETGYNRHILWLDKDKQSSSIIQCRKWKQYGYNISPIITDLDPKEYSTEQINNYLKELT